jgi:hypothetical protein
MRLLRLLLALAVLGLPFAPTAVAQQTESRLVGTIADSSQSLLPGVTVTVTSQATGAQRVVITEADGRYTVTNLPRGTYVVSAALEGFRTVEQTVTLGVGEVKGLDLSLSVAAMAETVTVTADTGVLDASSAKIGVNVTPEEVDNLPVNGRNFANLMTLSPGATTDGNGGWSSIRFNGKSNQQNYLNYDGIDGTYVWDASPGYLNATGSQFRLQTSMESVAEFRVNAGLSPAESGLGTGGNITVVTKSGANRLSGSVFEYYRDDALDATNKYDDIKQPLRLDQFGGSVGGPIVSNKVFFFGSYEGLRQDTGLSFIESVPSDLARGQILAGVPTTTGGGRSPERTRAVAPLLAGFPTETLTSSNPVVGRASNSSVARQREDSFTGRLDWHFSNSQSAYVRYLYSDGEIDTPDQSVTPRRVRATQRPQNFIGSWQSIVRPTVVNELKIGYNRPETAAVAFGPAGYPSEQVSLSGAVGSSSIDGRGTTGIARSGLQLRATSAAQGAGSLFEPASFSFTDAITMTRGTHTFKAGGEYRRINVGFQFLGGDTYEFNSVVDFIDNRPNRVQRALDSPWFNAQQQYAIAYVQDSWRPTARLTLDLGLRYEFYSVVSETSQYANPFFIEENDFATDPDNFYEPDYNNIGPRLSATYLLDDKTVLRGGLGWYYGPGQFEDRIQPIENYITRSSVSAADVANNALQYPVTDDVLRTSLNVRGYTHERPDEYNVQYGVSVQRELPWATNLSIGYTGSQGYDLFQRGVSNLIDPVTLRRPRPEVGQVDFKTSGGRSQFDALQLGLTRRFRGGLTGGFQYQYAHNTGTTQGSNEAQTAQNTFDFSTEQGANSADIRHTTNASLVYLFPGDGFWSGGWRLGGILNARSGVPINVTIARPDNVTVNGVAVANIPGGNSRGTQRPDLVPGVDPYLKDGGTRWLNPAAFATPQPGTFGNMPRNYLTGPGFWQVDLMGSKDFRFSGTQALQFRIEMFNITNQLNYQQPAASLPNGAPGVAFNDSTAGATFGYMLGPLNRTIGLGTQRQVQLSVRYTF